MRWRWQFRIVTNWAFLMNFDFFFRSSVCRALLQAKVIFYLLNTFCNMRSRFKRDRTSSFNWISIRLLLLESSPRLTISLDWDWTTAIELLITDLSPRFALLPLFKLSEQIIQTVCHILLLLKACQFLLDNGLVWRDSHRLCENAAHHELVSCVISPFECIAQLSKMLAFLKNWRAKWLVQLRFH